MLSFNEVCTIKALIYLKKSILFFRIGGGGGGTIFFFIMIIILTVIARGLANYYFRFFAQA